MIEGNNACTYHFDAIGSTMAITDQSENIVNQYAYSPYGRDLGKAETRPQPFTYVGQHGVMAEQNDHYYMRARYYDADTGRFISEDPIGFEGGINLYAYASNNPVMFIDPLGLCSDSFWQKYQKNYKNQLNTLYGQDLELADNSGLWGLSALAVNFGVSGFQSLTESLATEQIVNAGVQGPLTEGNILLKTKAANLGAKTAGRTAALRTGMRATGIVGGIVTAGATGYSVGARLNAGARALFDSF